MIAQQRKQTMAPFTTTSQSEQPVFTMEKTQTIIPEPTKADQLVYKDFVANPNFSELSQ